METTTFPVGAGASLTTEQISALDEYTQQAGVPILGDFGDAILFIKDTDTGIIYEKVGSTVVKYGSDPTSLIKPNDTGVVLSLNSIAGRLYNMDSPDSGVTYTTENLVRGGYAECSINSATEPTVTGATKITSSDFQVSTNMYMVVQCLNGTDVEYFFLQKV